MAQVPMEEAVNAFKRSLAGVDGVVGDLKRAIRNIEKTAIEQLKKQGETQSNNNSSSDQNSSEKKVLICLSLTKNRQWLLEDDTPINM